MRKALTEAEWIEKSRLICEHSLALIKSAEASQVHLFLPIRKFKEVDTRPIYDFLVGSEAHTPVISKMHWQTRHLSHHPMRANDALKTSERGIPEPVHQREINPKKLDMILVPLLAFDRKGNRLGYGAGFYDRFLQQCPQAIKVGLSLLPMHKNPLPVDKHDIRLDYGITPSGVIEFFPKVHGTPWEDAFGTR